MSVACVGDNVVDIYPSRGEMFPGGNAVNVAVAARRAGVRAGYVGVTGTDAAGVLVREALSTEGVDLQRMRVRRGPNAFATVELIGGDRFFLQGNAGVSQASVEHEDLEYLKGFDVIHTGDNGGLEAEVARLAQAAEVCFDFGDRSEGYWGALARHVGIACFSKAGSSAQACGELAAAVLAAGPRLVLISRGSHGASVFEAAGRQTHLPAAEVALVDTLGAGDALIGTFLAAITRGAEPAQALAQSIEAAADTCRGYGAFGYGRPVAARASEQSLEEELRR